MSSFLRLLQAVTPLGARNFIRDLREKLLWHTAPKAAGRADYGLDRTQIYPNGHNFGTVLGEAVAEKLQGLALKTDTPVASIGTCFAEEFALFMQKRGYNYISTEPDVFYASAKWGRVYTIPNFLQIVRYSFDADAPLVIEQGPGGWFDAMREYSAGTYPDQAAAEDATRLHRKSSREAFTKASVLILTVGQNEAWVDCHSGTVWAQIPSKALLKSGERKFEPREFSYEENMSALSEALAILFRHNPGLQVLMTVSPVASYATFLDKDVVSQSMANKCLLRVIVRDIVNRHPGKAFYFPSFELVLGLSRDAFRADNRHVKHARVGLIFDTLARATGLDKD